MRRVAGITLLGSASVLAILAIAVNAPALFYMGTAMIATLLVCRLQAWLSVRGLRFERLAPPTVSAGEMVTVELAVWSEYAIRRPLVSVADNLPESLPLADRTPSLPIAPAHNVPIRTQYQFRPLKRGRYRWDSVTVGGTDALGLIRMTKIYSTEPAEMTVLPTPIPVQIEVPRSAGWGMAESDHGKSRGAGLEPRGVREYGTGDSLRFVHWRSTARTGHLLVKEFETGSYGKAAFLLQRTIWSDIGGQDNSSLDRACGHVAYIAFEMLKQGTDVHLPALLPGRQTGSIHQRHHAILAALAGIADNQKRTLGEELTACREEIEPGTTVYLTLSVADESLPVAAATLRGLGIQVVALTYDPAEFPLGRRATRQQYPTEPGYMARLRTAGIRVVIMPAGGRS